MAGRKYTEEQREQFFRLLDRGGTVRAAARAVGVHEDAGYNWLRNTGLTMQRATPRVYPAELKAEFLRLVRERQIISTVARELGIHRPTAYAWARKAGISTSEARNVNPRREEFLRLRASGLIRAEARAGVGADARSATDWDKGITIISRGRVYADGRVVRYTGEDRVNRNFHVPGPNRLWLGDITEHHTERMGKLSMLVTIGGRGGEERNRRCRGPTGTSHDAHVPDATWLQNAVNCGLTQ